MEGLTIGGVVPLSALDFPETLATVIYCPGDPWGCPYGGDPSAQAPGSGATCDAGAVLAWLESRRGQVDAVLFSGGEPTLLPDMAATLAAVRELGFLTGLHTTGLSPDALAAVLPHLDFVGLDLKGPRAAYARLSDLPGGGEAAFASLDLLLGAAIPFEAHTTWHPTLLEPDALVALAGELAAAGAPRWTLQTFRPGGDAADAAPLVSPQLLFRLQAAAPRLAIDVRA